MAIRFGVDVDGVLYKWEPTVRYLIKRKFGLELKAADHWDALDNQLTNNQKQWLWTAGIKEGMFRHGHVYKGAIDGINSLSTLGDVHLITSRPASAREDTMAWVAFHRLPVSSVTVLRHGDSKADYPMDVFIDDGPHNITDVMMNTDAYAVLWDRPWNQQFDPQGLRDPQMFKRTNKWEDVLEEFS